MIMPMRPMPSMPPSRPNIPKPNTLSKPNTSSRHNMPQKPTEDDSQFNITYGNQDTKSVFELRRGLKKAINRGVGYKSTRKDDFSLEDKARIERLILDDKTITRDGKVSKYELERIWKREIAPKLQRNRDPETGKWMNPYETGKDRFQRQDWQEFKGYVEKMLGKKLQ